MLDENRVRRWQAEGVIEPAQAERMLHDLRTELAGELDRDWAHTRTGSLFVFASAILNGLILVLFTWVYDLDVTTHTTFLLWMICILPMVYTLRTASLAVLLSLLFMTWATLFCFRGLETMSVFDRVIQLPALYLVCGLTLFSVGGLHYRFPSLRRLARAFRVSALQITLLSLFGLGVRKVAEGPSLIADVRDAEATLQVSLTTTALAVIGVLAALANIALKRKGNEDLTRSEGPVILSLLGVAIVFLWVPLPTFVFMVLFGALQVALIGAVLWVGYGRRDLRIINIASLALLIVIGIRYVDLAWEELPLSSFVVGGLVTLALVGGGLEVPRRWLARKVMAEAKAASPSDKAAAPASSS